MDLVESLILHGLEFDLLGEKGMVNMGAEAILQLCDVCPFHFSERTD